jgi:hypothetical protein
VASFIVVTHEYGDNMILNIGEIAMVRENGLGEVGITMKSHYPDQVSSFTIREKFSEMKTRLIVLFGE